jgi:hypothetical protein|nr:MAG: protein of unknown function (DUF1351) [Bacteriophage sp.]DAJ18746.1 MAG TPA: Protein of unknown function (DUF1351) [Siphoviridae sp. ctoof1]DAK51193.1 MAG TPA: Protein of unknown function (DUF1351) [Caudoviricetes sp.]DAS62380.1 MAG TPA: Protein of unknown function (DUF1351) [Caudoviricetes sp.]DAU38074.1 MAG TPA: Protein of unknown function (DUF1351) [Caudoviricetes sp.]
MDNTLMKVTQLPVIEEHLRSRKEQTEQRVAEAMSLVCTDETLTSVKNIRAEMNREFADAETQRKAIKSAIMEKYDSFESVYRECIADPYKRADADLKAKIDATESEIKSRCEEMLLGYFRELCAVNEIDFLSFGQTGVKVDMASARAKTPKKLMEQIKLKVDGVAQDMKTIGTMGENAPEIMVEYKNNLDLSLAISVVNERHRRAEEEREAVKRHTVTPAARAAGVTVAAAPQVVPKRVEQAAVEHLTVSFRVTDTRERLRLLKQFLVSNGYQYE